MKTSKIFLLAFIFILTSCSDDDSSNTNSDPEITGKWELNEIKTVMTYSDNNGTTTEENSMTLENCNPKPTWDFMANGNFTATDFTIDFENSSCFVDGENTGEWEKIGSNTYQISEGLTTNSETVEVEVQFNTSDQIEIVLEQSEGEADVVLTVFANRV